MDAVEINTSEPPQNDEGIVSAMEICRVCLLGNVVMRDLFHETDVTSLSAKAMSFASVKVRYIFSRLRLHFELINDILFQTHCHYLEAYNYL